MQRHGAEGTGTTAASLPGIVVAAAIPLALRPSHAAPSRAMATQPLNSEHRALLEARHLQPPFPPAAAAEVLGMLRARRLAKGDMLMRQGEPGDDMYLVLSGRVAVQVTMANGDPTVVDEIADGGVVG